MDLRFPITARDRIMTMVCARCRRNLPSSEEPPSFCAFCGHRLSDPTTPVSPEPDLGSTIAQADPTAEAEVGDVPHTIGGYKLLRLLGTGGMGRVFEAESMATGQRVAVKLLSGRLTNNSITLERFRQEGRLASQLSHPRCVFVLAADTEHNRPYIVMELMPGETLKDLLQKRGPLPPQEAIAMILDVIEGLEEAHRLGVIHRDVKPSNCFMLEDDRVKIGDFGLSKSLAVDGQLTQTGAFLGTVLYASPEQIRGEEVDYGSDVYSVCATLFEMLTGKPPFEHENITAALAKIISEDAPPVRSLRPEVPRSLAKIVERGLERDRTRRWQNLEELREALHELVPGKLIPAGFPVRIAAYLLDELFVRLLLLLPLAALNLGLVGARWLPVYASLLVFPLYFLLLEGVLGASIGKHLLRLRVCRIGSTDPPGMKHAAIRTGIFSLLVTFPLILPRMQIQGMLGTSGTLLLAAIPLLVGLIGLLLVMRRRSGFRGIHEWLSGTIVLRLPMRRRALRLSMPKMTPLQAIPPRRQPIPEAIGPYRIRGAVPISEGHWILIGEDQALSRSILLRVFPTLDSAETDRHGLIRRGRLRFIQHGGLTIDGKEHTWEAYAVPSGAPLTDVVMPGKSLGWPVTRHLLEQLADELHAAEQEGSIPANLSVEQVWIQAEGRVQLLDFPIPRLTRSSVPGTNEPLTFLREVAALALEGQPVTQPAADRAIPTALPLHACELLRRLYGRDQAFTQVEEFRSALATTRDLPTEVTPRLRLGQLLMQAALLAPLMVVMFVLSGLFTIMTIATKESTIQHARKAQEMLKTAEGVGQLHDDPQLRDHLQDPKKLHQRLEEYIAVQRTEIDRMDPSLDALERLLLHAVTPRSLPTSTEAVQKVVHLVVLTDPEDLKPEPFAGWREACLLILLCPLVWVAGAFAFRGGLSYWFVGISVVRRDGRPATRRQCGLRALVVWLPLAILLSISVWSQVALPQLVVFHGLMWMTAFALLPIYFVLALRNPDRPVHDRLLGTRLMPR